MAGRIDNLLGSKLFLLEKQMKRQAAHVPPDASYEFKVAPSCPPDKRLQIQGGIPRLSQLHGGAIQHDFIPTTVCDFENEAETQMQLSFTNANYYWGIILCYYAEWIMYAIYDPDYYGEPVFDNVIGTEVETAAEAEAEIDAFMNGVEQWYYHRMPLCGVVFRNDGQTGISYSILPVDAVNRGRSYIYRDLRSMGGVYP